MTCRKHIENDPTRPLPLAHNPKKHIVKVERNADCVASNVDRRSNPGVEAEARKRSHAFQNVYVENL